MPRSYLEHHIDLHDLFTRAGWRDQDVPLTVTWGELEAVGCHLAVLMDAAVLFYPDDPIAADYQSFLTKVRAAGEAAGADDALKAARADRDAERQLEDAFDSDTVNGHKLDDA